MLVKNDTLHTKCSKKRSDEMRYSEAKSDKQGSKEQTRTFPVSRTLCSYASATQTVEHFSWVISVTSHFV